MGSIALSPWANSLVLLHYRHQAPSVLSSYHGCHGGPSALAASLSEQRRSQLSNRVSGLRGPVVTAFARASVTNSVPVSGCFFFCTPKLEKLLVEMGFAVNFWAFFGLFYQYLNVNGLNMNTRTYFSLYIQECRCACMYEYVWITIFEKCF
jgi:hypothetical protein